MKPPIALTDPRFKYTNAASTDLAKTFARVRREQMRERVLAGVENPPPPIVIPIRRNK